MGRVQETMSVNFFGVLVLLLSLILGGSAFAKTSPKPWSHTLFKTLPNLVVEVIDPNEIPVSAGQPKPEPVRYKSYRGSEFIDKVLGGRVQWINKKYLAFTCADGYRAVLPVEDFRQNIDQFFIAFGREDKKNFTIKNQLKAGKEEKLDPFYLIWKDAKMQTHDKAHYWPYQVVGIEATDKN